MTPKEKKNLEEYLNVKVNTYICMELYRLMKDNKDDKKFVDPNSRKGKRKKYRVWADCFRIGIQKVNRIRNELGNSRYASEEVETLARELGIDRNFFLPSKCFLDIKGIGQDAWQDFFESKHVSRNEQHGRHDKEKSISKKIESAVLYYINPDNADYIDYTNPINVILYFYQYGRTYSTGDISKEIKNKMDNLNNISPKQWATCQDSEIQKYIEQFKDLAKMLEAYLIYKKNF